MYFSGPVENEAGNLAAKRVSSQIFAHPVGCSVWASQGSLSLPVLRSGGAQAESEVRAADVCVDRSPRNHRGLLIYLTGCSSELTVAHAKPREQGWQAGGSSEPYLVVPLA